MEEFMSLSHIKVGLLSLAKALVSGRLEILQVLEHSQHHTIFLRNDAHAFLSALDGNSPLIVNIELPWFWFPDLDLCRKQLIKRNATLLKNLELFKSLLGDNETHKFCIYNRQGLPVWESRGGQDNSPPHPAT
jgi:hypothetical protein